MATRPGVKDFLWFAGGATILLGFVVAALHFHDRQALEDQLAFKTLKMELVDRMRLNLASASEGEKSAVLAITDESSQAFAVQARAASAAVERDRKELENLLGTGSSRGERESLERFSRTFVELRRVDEEVLALAVKNTNLKASSLAFGPAAAALGEMDEGLARLPTASASAAEAARVRALADAARIAALRIQALLPPHIAAESDQKMDALEARMAEEGETVRRELEALAKLPEAGGSPDLETAVSSWTRFDEIKREILALSRENTNVTSSNLSLTRKREAMVSCQDALVALREAIELEPIAGAIPGRRGGAR